jgi:hypothetical protein
LRHSYASYRFAQTGDARRVARGEAHTSRQAKPAVRLVWKLERKGARAIETATMQPPRSPAQARPHRVNASRPVPKRPHSTMAEFLAPVGLGRRFARAAVGMTSAHCQRFAEPGRF